MTRLWNIHELNADGTIGRFMDSGTRSKGETADAALEAAANSEHASMYVADRAYFVSPKTEHFLAGAKVLRLAVPPSPVRIAEAVSL